MIQQVNSCETIEEGDIQNITKQNESGEDRNSNASGISKDGSKDKIETARKDTLLENEETLAQSPRPKEEIKLICKPI